MTNLMRVAVMVMGVVLLALPAMAQEPLEAPADAEADAAAAAQQPLFRVGGGALGVALGVGIVMLGAGFGIGRIGGQAVEGMARQPEAAGSIQTGMLISAALIEGATFFALIVCLLALYA